MGSQEDVAEVLIAEIQARPALWNTKLPSYKNRNLRDDRLYSEVAEILSISKETVAARWKNKKDKYRRELKYIPISHSGDAADNYKSTWPYFESMSFLKDLLTPAVKSGNLSIPEVSITDEENDDRIDTQLGEVPVESVSSPPSLSATSTTTHQQARPSSASSSSTTSYQGKGSRKRLCDVRDDKFLAIENKKLQILAETMAQEPESEELYFFKSLIPYVQKFNPIQKMKVRNKIQQVILDELLLSEDNSRYALIGESTRGSIHQYNSPQDNNMTLQPLNSTYTSTLPTDHPTLLPAEHPYQY